MSLLKTKHTHINMSKKLERTINPLKKSLTYFDKRLQTNSNFQIEFVSKGYLKHQNSIQQSLKNRFHLFCQIEILAAFYESICATQKATRESRAAHIDIFCMANIPTFDFKPFDFRFIFELYYFICAMEYKLRNTKLYGLEKPKSFFVSKEAFISSFFTKKIFL